MTKTNFRREKKEKSKARKIFEKVAEVISTLILVLLVAMIIIAVVQKFTGKESQIFGYSITRILTGSMEPKIMTGDVILEKAYNGEELKVGDVITFRAPESTVLGAENKNYTITHRIIELEATSTGYSIRTKGDANSAKDNFTITEEDVVSTYVCTLKVMTVVFKIVSSFWGFICIIVLPLVFILIVQIAKLAKIKNAPESTPDEKQTDEKISFTDEEIKKYTEEEKEKNSSKDDN